MTKQININISEDLHKRFKTLCFAKKTTMTKFLSDYIVKECNENTGTITDLHHSQETKENDIFLLDRLKKAFGCDEKKTVILSDSNDTIQSQSKFHFVEVYESYKEPYSNLELKGFDCCSRRPICSIQDVLLIREDIPSMNKKNLKQFAKKYNMHIFKFHRLVWNIEEGNFDELIDEYFSRNFSFENRNNFLYIDGKYTGLSIQKCRVIIHTLINSSDKQSCINGFIKSYYSIKPKYIRIICDEYNNPNLYKVLQKEIMKIDKVNHPQKRKEQGMV